MCSLVWPSIIASCQNSKFNSGLTLFTTIYYKLSSFLIFLTNEGNDEKELNISK